MVGNRKDRLTDPSSSYNSLFLHSLSLLLPRDHCSRRLSLGRHHRSWCVVRKLDRKSCVGSVPQHLYLREDSTTTTTATATIRTALGQSVMLSCLPHLSAALSSLSLPSQRRHCLVTVHCGDRPHLQLIIFFTATLCLCFHLRPPLLLCCSR
jgi:hypothetical protein